MIHDFDLQNEIKLRGFVPGSVIHVTTRDPLKFIASIPKHIKAQLDRTFFIIVTHPHTEFKNVSEEYLEHAGLKRYEQKP